MTEFDDLFGENGEGAAKHERIKQSRLEYEGALSDIRAMVDSHIQGFLALDYSREEALYFGGQLHVLLLNAIHSK